MHNPNAYTNTCTFEYIDLGTFDHGHLRVQRFKM